MSHDRGWLNNGTSLVRTLTGLNRVADAEDEIERCDRHFKLLNTVWNDCYRHRRDSNRLTPKEVESGKRTDAQAFPAMLVTCLSAAEKQRLARQESLATLAKLQPLILNHDSFVAHHAEEGSLNSSARSKANVAHRHLIKAFEAYAAGPSDAGVDESLEALATLLYVIRSNIAHGHKTPEGPDTKKRVRDEAVSVVTCPVLDAIWSILLGRPEHRLAVYGTLRRDGPNHSLVANIPGEWGQAFVEGDLHESDGMPHLRWRPGSGTKIGVDVLASEHLADAYERLDRFEGSGYRRSLVPVELGGSLVACTMYVTNR